MPARLPLFPLDLVLYPGEHIPLHIFEPRYRQLLADCLEGNKRFGITTASPPVAGAIGSVAQIRRAEPLGDGRSNIIVLGEGRFGVRALLDEGTPYFVASVEEFSDHPDTVPSPRELEELRQLGVGLRDALGVLADRAGDEPAWSADPELLSFEVASLLDVDLDTRLRLLAGRSTRDRVRAMLGLLPGLVTMTQSRAEVHVRARSNGKGHDGSEIVHE